MAARRSPKKHLSVRIPADLDAFLREKGEEHAGGFNGLIEDVLTVGAAAAYGYEPQVLTPAAVTFAEAVASIVLERMEEKKGSPAKGKANK